MLENHARLWGIRIRHHVSHYEVDSERLLLTMNRVSLGIAGLARLRLVVTSVFVSAVSLIEDANVPQGSICAQGAQLRASLSQSRFVSKLSLT